MKSISAKLSLWILVFPIVLIFTVVFTLLTVGIYLYRVRLEIPVILDIIPPLLSVVLVNLLVWERLRDSVSKKLEYLHKNFLSKLYKTFQTDVLYFSKVEVKEIRFDLERYGKFMSISLYPRSLLKKIDDFLVCDDELSERVSQINDIGKKLLYGRPHTSLDMALWHHLLGIRVLEDVDFQSYTGRPILESYAEQARITEKEKSKLIEETKNLYEEGERIRKEIFEKLEEFLKSNNLRLEPEPLSYVSPY